MIVDMHAHIGGRKGILYTGDDILREMDAAGVDRCVVFTQVEEIDNDYAASQVRAHPDRLIGFCMVNPWDPHAEQEMRRCYADLGMRGVKMHPVRQGVAFDRHGVLDDLFRLCEEYSAVFYAHGASEAFNGPGKFEEMARSFASVPIVMGHSGTPWGLGEAIEVGRHCPNVYFATALADRRQLRAVMDALGADRVVLATDAPFNQFDREIRKVRDISAPDEAALALGGNTLRLIGEPPAEVV